MRNLVRQSQLSQQGLAALMAELIQTRLNEALSKTSLVAGLSRFINGKGSEFPAWFARENERLLPLALALGAALLMWLPVRWLDADTTFSAFWSLLIMLLWGARLCSKV